MQPDVMGILLVPSVAHREAMIGDGPCGSRAPLAYRATLPSIAGDWCGLPRHCHWEQGHALVLAWQGRPVPDGVFRAWDYWGPDEDEAAFRATLWTTYDVLAEALGSLSAARWLAESLERAGRGRLVLIDAYGREVAP